ncbi:MAG: hypothetical protein MK120_08040, partial [Puniceicoccaceae bacterium]|nr:hypothetical protein [Puniceicoccaceae bacterium]
SARYVTVLVLSLKEEPVFSAPKTIYLPQRELEHQMAVAEFQNAAATQATIPTLTTESLLATLPALTALPDVEFTPVNTEAMISDSDALFGQSGLMGALGALSSQVSSVSFLGITEEASRFVIVLDVSKSVVEASKRVGIPFNNIRAQAIELVENLNANTLFGFVLHGRKYLNFNDSLIPATKSNKNAAIRWLKSKFNDSGRSPNGSTYGENRTNGLYPILNSVFDMQPDVIFLVSNGGYFTNNNNDNNAWGIDGIGRQVSLKEISELIKKRQKGLTGEARIHSIIFPDKQYTDGRIGDEMRRIASRNGGKSRKIGR